MLLGKLAIWTAAAAVTPSTRKNSAAALMSHSESSGWKGKLVARILPEVVEGDYEVLHKPTRKIDPSKLLQRRGSNLGRSDSNVGALPTDLISMGELTKQALTSRKVRWITLDVYLTNHDEARSSFGPLHVHMNRGSQEEVASALRRMEVSVSRRVETTMPYDVRKGKATKRKAIRQETDHIPDPTTRLWVTTAEDQPGSRDALAVADRKNGEFWAHLATDYAHGNVHLSLKVDSADAIIPIDVDSCPPSVVGVRAFENLEGRVYVGVPLALGIDLLFAAHAIVDWYVDGELVSTDSRSYTPTEFDLGKAIAFLITPIRPGHDGHGYEEAYEYLHSVEARPENALLNKRPEWTRPRRLSDTSLRVLSYNVLADLNAFHDVRGMRPCYPYCETGYMKRERRFPVILHEILSYHADVVCLQEVDKNVFESLFLPTMEVMGYQGYYQKKLGSSEGIAMFWSLETFERAGDNEMNWFAIQRLFPGSKGMTCLNDWKSMHSIDTLLKEDNGLRKIVEQKTGHVLQVASLTLKGASGRRPRNISVANTHLFYHPMGGHIRLMQLYTVCHHIEKLRGGSPLLFCGDLNSTLNSGPVQLMTCRTVPANHRTWRNLNTYSWEGDSKEDDGRLASIPISLPDSFPYLCSGYEEFPPFTHYIREFSGTLDYIWASLISKRQPFGFKPKASAPTLTAAEVRRNVAMPSKTLPSDHVSLVCDLEFDVYDAE